MSSRVERKAAARAARLAAEADARRHAARQRALIRLGAVAGIALIVVAAAVLLSSRAARLPPRGPGRGGSTLQQAPKRLSRALRSPDAAVTLRTVSPSLQVPLRCLCPRRLPTVVDQYMHTGQRFGSALHLSSVPRRRLRAPARLFSPRPSSPPRTALSPFVDACLPAAQAPRDFPATTTDQLAPQNHPRRPRASTSGAALADRDRPGEVRSRSISPTARQGLRLQLGSGPRRLLLRRGHGPPAQVEALGTNRPSPRQRPSTTRSPPGDRRPHPRRQHRPQARPRWSTRASVGFNIRSLGVATVKGLGAFAGTLGTNSKYHQCRTGSRSAPGCRSPTERHALLRPVETTDADCGLAPMGGRRRRGRVADMPTAPA